MDDIGAEHRAQLVRPFSAAHLRAPGWIGQIDPQWRTDIRKIREGSPCLNAFEMLFVKIARPPGDIRKMAGQIDHMLAGAASDLDRFARCSSEVLFDDGADSFMVTMEGGRVEPAVGFARATVLSEFDDIFRHGALPAVH